MGPTATCVDTMETIMKSWISPHLFGVLRVCVCACVLGGLVTLLAEVCTQFLTHLCVFSRWGRLR